MGPSSRSSHAFISEHHSKKSGALQETSLNISKQLFAQNLSVTSDKKVFLVKLNNSSAKRRKLNSDVSNKENS